jgi:predicted glutamine amidotransferase
MCRLLAYVSETRRAVEDVLGTEEFASFRDLSHLHRDGWGMAWLSDEDDEGSAPGGDPGIPDEDPGIADEDRSIADDDAGIPDEGRRILIEGRLRATRSVLPAYEDATFAALAGRPLAAAGLVHLRWATSGIPIVPANTHPFLAHGWAFAHQGSIPSLDRLDALLTPEWSARRRGTTDSERYFLYLLQCVEREGSLIAGIRQAVNDIVSVCGVASLNAVLLSPSSVVVVHGKSGLESPRDDILAAVGRPEHVPPDHLEAYFRLGYRRVDGDVVVTSSGVAGEGWEEVPDDSIMHIDLDTRSMTFHAFDSSVPLAGAYADLSSHDC